MSETVLPKDKDGNGWQLRAGCRDVDPEVFFVPDGERGLRKQARERVAKAVCKTCIVVDSCAMYALSTPEESGVWGCMTEDERTLLLKISEKQKEEVKTGGPNATQASYARDAQYSLDKIFGECSRQLPFTENSLELVINIVEIFNSTRRHKRSLGDEAFQIQRFRRHLAGEEDLFIGINERPNPVTARAVLRGRSRLLHSVQANTSLNYRQMLFNQLFAKVDIKEDVLPDEPLSLGGWYTVARLFGEEIADELSKSDTPAIMAVISEPFLVGHHLPQAGREQLSRLKLRLEGSSDERIAELKGVTADAIKKSRTLLLRGLDLKLPLNERRKRLEPLLSLSVRPLERTKIAS